MWRVVARHMAAAITAWGRTAVEEHKVLNAQITLLLTDFVQSLNRFRNFYYVFLSQRQPFQWQ